MADSDLLRAWGNGKEHVVATLTQLRALIRETRRFQFGDFGLFQGELPDHNLFCLFNGRKAWPNYTYKIDQKSYSVLDPTAPEDVEIDFKWRNGQIDSVSAQHVVSSVLAVKVFEHFYRNRELCPNIPWHQDF